MATNTLAVHFCPRSKLLQREEEGNRAGRIRLLSPLRVFLPIKDQLTVRLEGCDQHYAMLQRNLLYTG